jgi:hypothetical protein
MKTLRQYLNGARSEKSAENEAKMLIQNFEKANSPDEKLEAMFALLLLLLR